MDLRLRLQRNRAELSAKIARLSGESFERRIGSAVPHSLRNLLLDTPDPFTNRLSGLLACRPLRLDRLLLGRGELQESDGHRAKKTPVTPASHAEATTWPVKSALSARCAGSTKWAHSAKRTSSASAHSSGRLRQDD